MRAENIIDALVTTLTGLTTTGTNIQRGQLYPHELTDLPALAVYMGQDSPAAEYQTDIIDWELTIFIESAVEKALDYTTLASGVDTTLNTIRKEVHAAIMADYTQGLSYVIDTTPGPAGQPILSGDAAKPIASQTLEYVIHYRTSRTALDA